MSYIFKKSHKYTLAILVTLILSNHSFAMEDIDPAFTKPTLHSGISSAEDDNKVIKKTTIQVYNTVPQQRLSLLQSVQILNLLKLDGAKGEKQKVTNEKKNETFDQIQ